MNKRKLDRWMLVMTAGLLVCALAGAEVTPRQINADNLVVTVNDDAWQPEGFENGVTVAAAYLATGDIVVDGRDDEPAWQQAPETKIALAFGAVKSAYLKALYSDQEVFIRVRWADATEDRQHRPWVWDAAREAYVEGSQLEDSVLLSFEAGCEWNPSLLAGYVYDFDGWQWLAARSDPLGQAIDLIGSVQDQGRPDLESTAYPSRTTRDTWNLKFTGQGDVDLHADWDQLDRVYMLQPMVDTVYLRAEPDGRPSPAFVETLAAPAGTPYPRDEGKLNAQYRPLKLTGGAGEVSARGQWADGYWTVEFRRARVTPAGTLNDVKFERLTQFSVHVFDHAERIDQSSESQRLFLRFAQPGQELAVQGGASR